MGNAQQSPINLNGHYLTDFGKDKLSIKWKKSATGTIEDDGHGIHVKFVADHRQYIELDRKRFHLVEFHFHHPSEHWVGGSQQTMELHVVHQNVDDGTRAVLGIFIEPNGEAESTPGLVAQMQGFYASQGDGSNSIIPTNPLEWLPGNRDEYYRYEGSLTTPKYDENVSWVILREPKTIPKAELSKLMPYLKKPARFPQPLNRRFILANFK